MKRWDVLLAMVSLLILAGCVSTPQRHLFGNGFDEWVDKDLGPYVVEQLSRNPRLRQGPVLLVKLDLGDVVPEIDRLTEDVRRRLFDRLIAVPGIDLAWRPTTKPEAHHRSLSKLDCGLRRQPALYVGLEIREASGGGYRASVRALDLLENSWVTGFGKTWSGDLDERQRTALRTAAADPYLRGLRPLPFEADQSDLAAGYLARNLSCLLAQGPAGRLRVHIEAPADDAPMAYRGIVTLVKRYINQYQEVDVIEDASGANAVVDSALVPVSGDLWQAWLGVRFVGEGDKRVSGADTPAYLRLPESAWEESRAPQAEPLVEKPDIRSFHAIRPPAWEYCHDDDPWAHGQIKVEDGEVLPNDGCIAVEAVVPEGSDAYLLIEEAEGGWSRLVPSDCLGGEYRIPSRVTAGGVFRFPRDSVLDLEGASGTERMYLITAQGLARQSMAQVIQRLPSGCGNTPSDRDSPLDSINQVMAAYPSETAMRRLEVYHAY